MGILDRLFGAKTQPEGRVFAAVGDGGTIFDLRDSRLAELIRGENYARSGASVTTDSAMRVAAVYACVRIIAGAVSSMPVKLYRQDGRERKEATDHPLWSLISRRPNDWQTSKRWRHLMQSQMLWHGNGYSLIARGVRRKPLALYPLDASRMEVTQRDDLSLRYVFQRRNGAKVEFDQSDILHLRGMTFDGVLGLNPISYAREAIGLSIQGERHGASMHKNGMQIGSVIEVPTALSDQAYKRLQDGMDKYRGAENAHKNLILEEGGKFAATMSNVDAQWLESRKFQRGDIFMFYGVPPHMAGDTDKATSWGTGLEQQSQGFVSYTLDDWLTEWEEGLGAALLTEQEADDHYFRYTRASLVRGDLKTRYAAHAQGISTGFITVNEARAMEELPPKEGGDELRVPLNTAPIGAKEDEPAQTA